MLFLCSVLHMIACCAKCSLYWCPEVSVLKHATAVTVCLPGSLEVLQSIKMCELLAGMLTKCRVLEETAFPPQTCHLSCLTRLTSLSLNDGAPLGSLSELRGAHALHTLTLKGCKDFPSSRAPNLCSLQKLTLRGSAKSFDLTCCTQLTLLDLAVHHNSQHLVLPYGDKVQLNDLCLHGQTRQDQQFVLDNLSFASKLTCLDFSQVYPSNLQSHNGWPATMPLLEHVQLVYSKGHLPHQWCHYPELTSLNLSKLQHTQLPEWFSGMTQLKSLHLSEAKFQVFPSCLLQLSNLSQLLLNDIVPPMAIPDEIAGIAEWQCLCELNLGIPINTMEHHSYDLDSEVCLLALCHLLKSRGVVVKLSTV